MRKQLLVTFLALFCSGAALAHQGIAGVGLGYARTDSDEFFGSERSTNVNLGADVKLGYRFFLGEAAKPYYLGPLLHLGYMGKTTRRWPRKGKQGTYTLDGYLVAGKYFTQKFDANLKLGASGNLDPDVGFGPAVSVGAGYKVAPQWRVGLDYYAPVRFLTEYQLATVSINYLF